MLLYTLGIRFYHTAAKVISPFNTKAKLFSQGRKNLFERIKKCKIIQKNTCSQGTGMTKS